MTIDPYLYLTSKQGHSAGAHLVAQVVLSDVIEKVKYYQAIAPSAQQTSHVSEKHDPTKHDRGTELPHDFLPPIEGLLLQVYLEKEIRIMQAYLYLSVGLQVFTISKHIYYLKQHELLKDYR